jgi:hypothetical protein
LGVNKKERDKTGSMERKMPGKIFEGKTSEDGRWRYSSIVQHIKAQRIRWLGHIGGMPEYRHLKRCQL